MDECCTWLAIIVILGPIAAQFENFLAVFVDRDAERQQQSLAF
jgi:hypothetical protein